MDDFCQKSLLKFTMRLRRFEQPRLVFFPVLRVPMVSGTWNTSHPNQHSVAQVCQQKTAKSIQRMCRVMIDYCICLIGIMMICKCRCRGYVLNDDVFCFKNVLILCCIDSGLRLGWVFWFRFILIILTKRSTISGRGTAGGPVIRPSRNLIVFCVDCSCTAVARCSFHPATYLSTRNRIWH